MHAFVCSPFLHQKWHTTHCSALCFFSPVSEGSRTAGYRGLPMPLYSIVWLYHGLHPVPSWGTFGLSFNTLGSFFLSLKHFSSLPWVPIHSSFLPLMLPLWLFSVSIICSFFSTHTASHWSLMPHVHFSSQFLPSSWGDYISITFMLMILRSISWSPRFFSEIQFFIFSFSLERSETSSSTDHWILISDNSFTTYLVVQMRNLGISFRSFYPQLLLSQQVLPVLCRLHSRGCCLGSGPPVRCPGLGLEI